MLCLQAPQSLIHTDTQEVDEKKTGSKFLLSSSRAKVKLSQVFLLLVCLPLHLENGRRGEFVLPQKHVKDPEHSAQSAGGRLQLHTHVCTLHMWLCMK